MSKIEPVAKVVGDPCLAGWIMIVALKPLRCNTNLVTEAQMQQAIAEATAITPEGWQPIETAPKTGRTILLGYTNTHGNWRTMLGRWFSQEEINETWDEPKDCDGLEGWYETSVEADDVPNCWATEPTHWMPLPAAPKGETL